MRPDQPFRSVVAVQYLVNVYIFFATSKLNNNSDFRLMFFFCNWMRGPWCPVSCSAWSGEDRTGRGQWPGRCCPVLHDAEALSTAQLAQRSRTIRSGSRNLWRGQPLASPLILVLFIKYGARCPSAAPARRASHLFPRLLWRADPGPVTRECAHNSLSHSHARPTPRRHSHRLSSSQPWTLFSSLVS